ncbi:ATP-dependent protease La Type II [hydrothermal vent metagenome]|uniref:ATP-dependent protease La Type II n=1 Tax=hydrothermal vent metagenome TaxID=652676 RepID=A0A3B0W500_9ZZZZ
MYNLQTIYARTLNNMAKQSTKIQLNGKLQWQQVRWQCDLEQLDFETTAELDKGNTMVGQHEALEALEYSIESRAFGQNAFVRGLHGIGRMEMICSLLNKANPQMAAKYDRCYVANFQQPDRPRLITLTAGDAKYFKRWMKKFADFVTKDLNNRIDSHDIKTKKAAIDAEVNQKIKLISEPFEQELAKQQLAMVNYKTEAGLQTVISPLHEEKPVNPQQWQELIAAGTITEQQQKQTQENIVKFSSQLQEMAKSISSIKYKGSEQTQELIETRTRQLLHAQTAKISKRFRTNAVQEYLTDACEDVIEQFFYSEKEKFFPHTRYNVNILVAQKKNTDCPIMIERVPTLSKLLGTIESKWGEKGPELSDHMSITAGTLLRADGGFLILDARDLLTEAGAWKILIRTIKNQLLEIVPTEMAWPFSQPTLKPEPIEVNVRVILMGDSQTYYMLDNYDPDFPDLFKVLADFDSEIKRNKDSFDNYAAVIARLVRQEKLLHFDKTAVAALIEHGARICSQKDRLTTNFPRIADLAREGNYLAQKQQAKLISAAHITLAIARTKKRAGLPSKKFQQMLSNGTINVFTAGEQVGEINGLAVISAGPIVYGFPSRITSTVAPGRAGVINIEGQADMSGSIHTKGFQILGGLLRHLLPTVHPLTFSASIAFEQSYGGIDGDSASGAEFCCLISAITNIPISQEFAMTGAIDQHGRLQAIGGVNEKIEGFFDTCQAQGFTDTQGVIIPQANAGDLMLRTDVQQAVKDNKFSIYAVAHVTQALEILCKQPAGVLLDGTYPKNSILFKAMEKSNLFWKNTNQKVIEAN